MEMQRRIIDLTEPRLVLELPASFANHRVEVIALTVDDDSLPPGTVRRRPHPDLIGQGRELGDIVGPIIDPEDWSDSL